MKKHLELWDLYDLNGQPHGRTHVRGEPMTDGDFHLVIQVWIRNSEGNYLIQKRVDNGIWAATAGCVTAGETSHLGAVRELKEELGIHVHAHEVRQVYADRSRYALGSAWLLERDVRDEEISIQPEEVMEIRWVNPETIHKMVQEGTFHDYGDEYFQHVFRG